MAEVLVKLLVSSAVDTMPSFTSVIVAGQTAIKTQTCSYDIIQLPLQTKCDWQ